MYKKIGIKELKKVKTYNDLEDLGIGKIYSNISYRGGGIGFYSSDVAMFFDVNEYQLPSKFGAACNYLGGGLRGSIYASDFSKEITGRKAKLLNELASACVRVYKNIDNEEIENNPINTGIGRVNQVSAY